MNGTVIWVFFSLASAFFAALVTIFAKIGLERIDSTIAATVKTLIMFTFLFFIALVTSKINLIKSFDFNAMLYIILAGISGGLSWVAFFVALQHGPASRVYALDRLSIVFVVLFATFIGEVLNWQKIFGALVLSVGAILIAVY
jgi:transporter family protein